MSVNKFTTWTDLACLFIIISRVSGSYVSVAGCHNSMEWRHRHSCLDWWAWILLNFVGQYADAIHTPSIMARESSWYENTSAGSVSASLLPLSYHRCEGYKLPHWKWSSLSRPLSPFRYLVMYWSVVISDSGIPSFHDHMEVLPITVHKTSPDFSQTSLY